jgi:hypothetical protein
MRQGSRRSSSSWNCAILYSKRHTAIRTGVITEMGIGEASEVLSSVCGLMRRGKPFAAETRKTSYVGLRLRLKYWTTVSAATRSVK